jgi:hypothetical protein
MLARALRGVWRRMLPCTLALQLLAANVARADAPKREQPDYDGRPNTSSAGHRLLVIPRVQLSPLYLREYVVRRPLHRLFHSAPACARLRSRCQGALASGHRT